MKKEKKFLYLIHNGHAKTDSTLLNDFKRPLSKIGIYKTVELATILSSYKKSPPPDCILCSSALRARQTYDLVSHIYPNAEVYFKDSLYLAPLERLKNILEELDSIFSNVMIIGHNDGLENLMHYLIRKTELQDLPLDSSSCSLLELNIASWKEIMKSTGKFKTIFNF